MAAHIRAGGAAPRIIELPVYPPAVLIALAPFALLPAGVANAVFVALLLPLPGVALWLLGVRDLRCYSLMYLSAPLLLGTEIGTLSPLLLVGCALVWYLRDRAVTAGLIVAALVCAKLFLWPLVVWFVITRRWRAAAVASGVSAVGTLAGFVFVGGADLRAYPHMLSVLSSIEQTQGYSAVAGASQLGAPATLARGIAVALGVALLATAWRAARRGDESAAFGIVVCAALVLTPIVWLHYLVLLFVPIALRRRTLGWEWAVPLLLWLTPMQQTIDRPWGIAVGMFAVGLAVAICLRGGDGGGWNRTSDEPVMSGLL